MDPDRRYDRLAGTLLGTALGDALGSGDAMRSAILGVFFCDKPHQRRTWPWAFAEVTKRPTPFVSKKST